MAQYRFSLQKAVSRGKGQSGVAKAAYNAREQLYDDHNGRSTRDYARPTKNSGGRDDILFSGMFLDTTKGGAPQWATDRNSMWNAQVAAEKRKDAREAQEIIVNLPHELTQKQREYMLTDFCREITRSTGRIADVNMHKAPKHGDDRNIHAHILLTVREIRDDGFSGKRLEVTPEQLEKWKEKWAARGARELRKAGFSLEADRWACGHLTKEKQREAALKRLDLEYAVTLIGDATKHLGPEAAAMERKGKGSDRSDTNRETSSWAAELASLKRDLAHVNKMFLDYRNWRNEREPEFREERFYPAPKPESPRKKPEPTPTLSDKAAKLAEAARLFLRSESHKTYAELIAEKKRDDPQKPPDRDRER